MTYLANGHAIDKRAYSDLTDMLNNCRDKGLEPVICSSYRSMEKQQTLFANKVNEYISYGYSAEEAEKRQLSLWPYREQVSTSWGLRLIL